MWTLARRVLLLDVGGVAHGAPCWWEAEVQSLDASRDSGPDTSETLTDTKSSASTKQNVGRRGGDLKSTRGQFLFQV